MAEGFEPYHVPQQSRRVKLRVNCDPSLISSDLINSCDANVHRQSTLNLGTNTSAGVKENGMNFTGFLGGMNMTSSASTSSSIQLNPNAIQNINGSQYIYPATHNYTGILDQYFRGNGQSLSLSLSSDQTHQSNLPLELNLQRHDSSMYCNEKISDGYFVAGDGCSTSVEFFTGYASVMKGSRFLEPVQQLLEEIFDTGREICAEKIAAESSFLDPPPAEILSANVVYDDSVPCSDGGEQTRKKYRLLSMLDEIYKMYKQYHQQMQAVVASFKTVFGLSSIAPLANMAFKAMSKHFRCLKNAIIDQLHFTAKSHDKTSSRRVETQKSDNSGKGAYGQRPLSHTTGYNDQPVSRPQRGLPEGAVTILKAWLFEHFLHPYPTDTDKYMLAKQTGLSRNQVSNWFINARVRLWKPMVEEIHSLEMRQCQKALQEDKQPANRLNDHLPTSCSVQKIGEFSLKRNREDITGNPRASEGLMNSPYDNLLQYPNLGVGVSNASSSGRVSLTLGLYQNGVGLSQSHPINGARRLGLNAHGEGYPVSRFAEENRRFGRDIMGRQLLHDFVG